jgi:ribonuclease BN (tRNA processing enzyme)
LREAWARLAVIEAGLGSPSSKPGSARRDRYLAGLPRPSARRAAVRIRDHVRDARCEQGYRVTLRASVLGFAGAAPLGGACPSYVIRGGERTVLLDCGPGALERLWREHLLAVLDAVVISHMHADHILDLLLMSGELGRGKLRAERPALYVPTGGLEVLARLDSVFSDVPPGESRFEQTFATFEYGPEDRLAIGGLELSFAPTAHRGLCCAVRVTDGQAVVVYGADGAPSEALEQLASGADLLILEATYEDDVEAAAAQGHMTALQAGELAARAGVDRLALTHLLPGNHQRLRAIAADAFGGPIELAREGLTFELA